MNAALRVLLASRDLLEVLSYLVIVVGAPAAIIQYVRAVRREQADREYGTYNALDEKYLDFQKLCFENPDLDIFDLPDHPPRKDSEESAKKELVAFTMLISIFERAYLMYSDQSSEVKARQWGGWRSFIESFCRRDNFRHVWYQSGSTFDTDFESFMWKTLDACLVRPLQFSEVSPSRFVEVMASSAKSLPYEYYQDARVLQELHQRNVGDEVIYRILDIQDHTGAIGTLSIAIVARSGICFVLSCLGRRILLSRMAAALEQEALLFAGRLGFTSHTVCTLLFVDERKRLDKKIARALKPLGFSQVGSEFLSPCLLGNQGRQWCFFMARTIAGRAQEAPDFRNICYAFFGDALGQYSITLGGVKGAKMKEDADQFLSSGRAG